MSFRVEDLNFMEIEEHAYDFILAHASLHHVINLEMLFAQIARGLRPGGIFHLVEVIGKNRRLLWDETEQFVNAVLGALPDDRVSNMRVAGAVDAEGMEGIRQEEILPLLHRGFVPVYEYRHGAFMRAICTDRKGGGVLDPDKPEDRRWLDFLIDLDRSTVAAGILKPLEVWGMYAPALGGTRKRFE